MDTPTTQRGADEIHTAERLRPHSATGVDALLLVSRPMGPVDVEVLGNFPRILGTWIQGIFEHCSLTHFEIARIIAMAQPNFRFRESNPAIGNAQPQHVIILG